MNRGEVDAALAAGGTIEDFLREGWPQVLARPCRRTGPLDAALEVRTLGSRVIVTPVGALRDGSARHVDGCVFDPTLTPRRTAIRVSDLVPAQAAMPLGTLPLIALVFALAELTLALRRRPDVYERGLDGFADGHGVVHLREPAGVCARLDVEQGEVVVQLDPATLSYRDAALPRATLLARGRRRDHMQRANDAWSGALVASLGWSLLAGLPALAALVLGLTI